MLFRKTGSRKNVSDRSKCNKHRKYESCISGEHDIRPSWICDGVISSRDSDRSCLSDR